MFITEKNKLITILLLISIFFSYTYYSQYENSTVFIEFSAENNCSSNSIISDSEIHEVDQIENSFEITSFDVIDNLHNYFHINCRLTQAFFPIWQPPKMN